MGKMNGIGQPSWLRWLKACDGGRGCKPLIHHDLQINGKNVWIPTESEFCFSIYLASTEPRVSDLFSAQRPIVSSSWAAGYILTFANDEAVWH